MYWIGHLFLLAAALGCGFLVNTMSWPTWWLVLPISLLVAASLQVDKWK